MLNILNQPEKNLRGLVLSSAPGLYTRKRNDKILVIIPNRGSWVIFDSLFRSFFEKIKKPILYQDFISNDQGIPPAMYVAFMESAFKTGILLLSGKQKAPDITSAGADGDKPRLLHIHPQGNTAEEFETFGKFIRNRMKIEKFNNYLIYVKGNKSPVNDGFVEFAENLIYFAKELNKNIIFSIDVYEPPAEIPAVFSDLPITLNYRFIGPEELYIKRKSKIDFNNILFSLRKTKNSGIQTGVVIDFHHPDEVMPAMEFFLDEGLSNIALKISPDVILRDEPITKSIRKMEDFANKYMEMFQKLISRIGTDHTRIFLDDINRFINHMTGKYYEHPCGTMPCGMGERIQVLHADGTLLACESVTGKSKNSLIMNEDDINCPGESNMLKYWRGRSMEKLLRCGRCPWRKFCSAGCPVLTYEKYGDLFHEDPRCRFLQMMFENLIWFLHDNPLVVNKIGGF
ncbi:MAG: SPASM domain-containing protein [Candidatus Eremiobacteraeota bacterium]|nr:SPASM domain-containing protein [Candidatus Eremiobacteraeota bacterium]